jgi:hypothetical protein
MKNEAINTQKSREEASQTQAASREKFVLGEAKESFDGVLLGKRSVES